MLNEILKKSDYFSGLGDNDIKVIAAVARKSSFQEGRLIFSQGNIAKGFYIIAKGSVRIFQLSSGGKEHLLHIFGKNEVFGEAAAFGLGIFPASCEALEDVELIFVPVKEFRDLLKKNPDLALNIIGTLSRLLHMFIDKIESLTLKEAPLRVADYLLSLVDKKRISDKKINIELPIKKSVIATSLDITQETLSRVLAKFRAVKIISVKGNKIIIENIQGLQSVSKKEPII